MCISSTNALFSPIPTKSNVIINLEVFMVLKRKQQDCQMKEIWALGETMGDLKIKLNS